eukprot:scaffold170394_cov15-Tisochrysis_lutea.AAC.1
MRRKRPRRTTQTKRLRALGKCSLRSWQGFHRGALRPELDRIGKDRIGPELNTTSLGESQRQ